MDAENREGVARDDVGQGGSSSIQASSKVGGAQWHAIHIHSGVKAHR